MTALLDSKIRTTKDVVDVLCESEVVFQCLVEQHRHAIPLGVWMRLRKACKADTNVMQSSPSRSRNIQGVGYSLPLFNVFYDLIMRTPEPHNIQLMLNIIVLANSLLLNISLGFTHAESYDTYISSIERFNGVDEAYKHYNTWCVASYSTYTKDWPDNQCGWAIFQYYSNCACMAAGLLAGSMLNTLVVYTSFVATSFSGPDSTSQRELVAAWWRPMLLSVSMSVLSTSGGVMYAVGATRMLAILTWPDYEL